MTTAFVTGTTGFLGSHFLIGLAGNHYEHAYVLVRGDSERDRRLKLLGALRKAGQSYSAMPDLDALMAHITIVPGDPALPSFGLDDEGLAQLRQAHIEHFWHFAATQSVEHYRKDPARSAQVDHPAHAAEFCRRSGIGHFVHVSTAYTCGARDGAILEMLHPQDGPFSNRYEKNKCRAEHALTQLCRSSGLRLTILRPSVVIGNSQTRRPGGADSGLYGFIREVRNLRKALITTNEKIRVFGNPDGEINFIPVDRLMEDIAELLDDGLRDGDIVHLTSDHNPLTGRVFDLICGQLGLGEVSMVPAAAGQRASSPLEHLLARKTELYLTYLQGHRHFSRHLSASHRLFDADLLGYIVEGIRAADRKDIDSTFDRLTVLASDGVALNVYRAGDRARPAVLICNDLGMPAEFVRPLAAQLARRWHVITWESRTLPGMARSRVDADVSLARQAADGLEVLDRLKVPRAALIGWCGGARVALRIHNGARRRIAGLALLNGSYGREYAPKTSFERTMAAIMPRIASDNHYARLFHRSIFTPDPEGEAPRTCAATEQLLASTAPEFLHLTSVPFHSANHLQRYARLVHALLRESISPSELDITVPTLVMTGDRDQTAHPEGSRALADDIVRSHFACVDGADHFALYRHEGFQSQVDAFVSALH
jgi:nucleoside-diphosphate-sugar epimerase/pimeloyl-ACP methyl ester carboxylesterase